MMDAKPATHLPDAPSDEHEGLWMEVFECCVEDDIQAISKIVKSYLPRLNLNFKAGPRDESPLATALRAQQEHRGSEVVIERLVATLVHFGANPLEDEGAMDMALAPPNGKLIAWLAEALAKRETRGQPLRAPDGGNLYHALAQKAPWYISELTSAWGLDKHWLAWIGERNATGNTPVDLACQRVVQGKDEPAWMGLQRLVDAIYFAKPHLLTLSEAGQAPAAEYILQALDQVNDAWILSHEARHFLLQTRAQWLTQQLEQGTAKVRGTGTKGPRL